MSKQQMLADLQMLRERVNDIRQGNGDVRTRLEALSAGSQPPQVLIPEHVGAVLELTEELNSLQGQLQLLRDQASAAEGASPAVDGASEPNAEALGELKSRLTNEIIQNIQQQHKASVATAEEASKLKKYILAEVKARNQLDEELSGNIREINRIANS